MHKVLCTLIAAALLALAPTPASAAEPTVADLFSKVAAVRVSGDRAYVAASAGLQIYDLSDGATPRKLSQLFLDRSGSFKVEVSGDYAFVLSGLIVFEETILRVVDVSDPLAPHVVGEFTDFPPPSRTQSMHFVGTTLAVGVGNVVELFDVSDPANLVRTGSLRIADDPEQIVGLTSIGTTLFATWQGVGGEGRFGAVTAIDVSDPAAPVELGVYSLGDLTPYSIASSGNALYVGTTPPVVLVLDATDPSNLREATRLDYSLTPFAEVYAKGELLFVGTNVGDTQEVEIDVYDVSNATAPRLLGETRVFCSLSGMDYDVARSAVLLPCATATASGMSKMTLGDDGKLVSAWSDFVPSINDVEIVGETTFLATTAGLWAVRPTANGRVEVIGTLPLSQPSLRLQIVGSRAYVYGAANSIGTEAMIEIVDIADPTAMRVLGSIAAEGAGYLVTSNRFYVVDETLYLVKPGGLEIYDASNPASLQLLGTFATTDLAENVIVDRGLAYLTAQRVEDGIRKVDLYVIKVKKPNRPKQKQVLRSIESANYTGDLELRDGRLYIAMAGPGSFFPHAGDGKIAVIKIKKGKKPKILSKFPTSLEFDGYAREVAVVGNTLYVADGLAGISIITVADDGSPRFDGKIDTPGFAPAVWIDAAGNVAVADQTSYQLYPPSAR